VLLQEANAFCRLQERTFAAAEASVLRAARELREVQERIKRTREAHTDQIPGPAAAPSGALGAPSGALPGGSRGGFAFAAAGLGCRQQQGQQQGEEEEEEEEEEPQTEEDQPVAHIGIVPV
jgi:hypothetical protein